MGFLTSNEDFGLALGLAENIRDARQKIRAQNERIAELELKLRIEEAHSEGLLARVKGFIEAHPDSPMRRDSGRRYEDGRIKSVSIGLYEKAFDEFLLSKGIKQPMQYRAG